MINCISHVLNCTLNSKFKIHPHQRILLLRIEQEEPLQWFLCYPNWLIPKPHIIGSKKKFSISISTMENVVGKNCICWNQKEKRIWIRRGPMFTRWNCKDLSQMKVQQPKRTMFEKGSGRAEIQCCSYRCHHRGCRHSGQDYPRADPGGAPLQPWFFFYKMQFSGNFKGKAPIWANFGLRAPLWGQNSAGPPDKNPGSAPAAELWRW